MGPQSDLPPSHTIEPADPPPPSRNPTSAMLKGDIDSGQTGDKNPVFDPSLSPLGTDDEAAGTPPTPFRVALARHTESVARWIGNRRGNGVAHGKADGVPVVFIGFILAVAAILLIGIWMVRGGSDGDPRPGTASSRTTAASSAAPHGAEDMS